MASKGIPRGIQIIEWQSDGKTKVGYRVRISRKDFKADKVFDDLAQAINFLNASKSVEGKRVLTKKEEEEKKKNDEWVAYTLSPQLSEFIEKYIEKYVKYSGEHPTKMRSAKVNELRLRAILKVKVECITKFFQNSKGGSNLLMGVKFPSKPLGEFKIEEVTEQTATEYIIERLKTVSKSTVVREVGAMQSFFNKLRYIDKASYDKLEYNPFEQADKSLLKGHTVKRKRRLEDGEEDRLLTALSECKNPEMIQIFMLSLLTGMRRGEVLNLRWDQIHKNGKAVYLDETKSSDRMAILNDDAKAVLETVKKKDERLFHYTADGFNSNWQRVKQRAKISNWKFHDCRREFISRTLEMMGSAPTTVLAEMAGFKDVAHVERSYVEPYKVELAVENGIKSESDLMRSVGHADRKILARYLTLKGK